MGDTGRRVTRRIFHSVRLRATSLSGKAIAVHVRAARRYCFSCVDRVAKVRVRKRCRVVSVLHSLSQVGGRCRHIRSTVTTIRRGKCKIIVPKLSSVQVRSPILVRRTKGCNIGVQTVSPSVRVVGTSVRARVTPVINDRRRTGSLVTCVHRKRRDGRKV